MSNMRIGGKVYRDVEKMSKEDLEKVAMVISHELLRLKTIKLTQHNVGTVQVQMQVIGRQTQTLEKLLKKKPPTEKEST